MEKAAEKLAKALQGYDVRVYTHMPPTGVVEHLRAISRETGISLSRRAFGHHFEPGNAKPIVLAVYPKTSDERGVLPNHVDEVHNCLAKVGGLLREKDIRALCTSIPCAGYMLISLNRKALFGWLGKRSEFVRILREKLSEAPK